MKSNIEELRKKI